MQQTKVVLGFEDPALQEEVLHFLDRLPGIRVAGAAVDGLALASSIEKIRPDAAVLSPKVLASAPDANGAALFVVSDKETVGALRAALAAGARGFYLWPEERDVLAVEARRAGRPRVPAIGRPGRVVAVFGPRGGAGATFLATNLAAACAAKGASSVVVDVDAFYADVTSAIGAPPTPETPTVADLAPVLDELTPEHLDRVLYRHPRGFRALLAPHDPGTAETLPSDHAARAAEILRLRTEVVVLHIPRGLDAAARAALRIADEILVVVTLDVMAFRDAHRALSYLEGLGVASRCRLVVNRASSGEVVPDDAERVFGLRPVAILRNDRAVPRAQNRGELIVGRSGQVSRCLAGLARQVVEAVRAGADRVDGAEGGS